MKAHVTHPVHVVHKGCTQRNRVSINPLPSVDDICAFAENESMEDAIIMAKNEISCLDDLSLEGDIPEDVSDEEDDH
jgi:hypothetical protein